MDKNRFQQLKNLVDRALDLDPAGRRTFLEENCGGDNSLLQEALQLLQHDAPDADDLNVVPSRLRLQSGETIGPYRIAEPIGEGGMGVVYLADQSGPLQRQVALKVIKVGMDTKEVISRFETERQALALMDHPNIAKVLDAGATEEGRPYFVMEYIKGIPLTRYCREQGLGLNERLELFIQVSRGVHHAHQKGVIHRDIKPGNILVTEVEGRAVPKIIDFGVARATELHMTAQTLFTQLGQLVGTPEYMSPEQADLTTQDIDTRSDVYSLGVVLYELITGNLPIDRKDLLRVGLEGMGSHLREAVPPRPSTRVTGLQNQPTSEKIATDPEPRTWARRIKGDLDWITMKALEKERDRRYGSAEDLGEDIVRHLGNHTVLAGPPSNAYRLGKFVRRNRMGVTAGALLLAALLAGSIGTTIGMVRAQRAETRALAAADRAEASTLYQMSRAGDYPASALPYAVAALERDDRIEYRLQAKRLLLESPPYWRLPSVPDSHNPYSIGISPDGSWMAVGWSKEGSLQLYSFDGTEPRMLAGHRGMITWIKFSSDSRRMVTASNDSTVKLWSLDDGLLLKSWHLPGEVVPFFDPANDRLITHVMSKDKQLRWQAWPLSGEGPTELGWTGPVLDGLKELAQPDLDPSRRWLILPIEDRIELFELADLSAGPVRTIGRHDREIAGVIVSPDSMTIACYDEEGGVTLWDLSSSNPDPIRRIQAKPRPIFVNFDASGKHLAVSGYGGLGIWDLTKPSVVEPLELVASHWMFAGAFHPSGDWFVTTSTMGIVAAWPLTADRPVVLKISENDQGTMGISPDGRHLILGSETGVVRDLPLDGLDIGEPAVLHVAEGFGFTEMRFDDESQYVFLSTCNSPRGMGTILRIPLEGGEPKLFTGFTCEFVLDAQGRFIASSGDQVLARPFVQIFDTQTGERTELGESVGGFTVAGGFTRDGRLLVGGPEGVGLWDMARGEFSLVGEGMTHARLGGDRRTIFMMGPQGQLWRRAIGGTKNELLPLRFPQEKFSFLGIDSTVSLPAACNYGGPLHILDMEAGQAYQYPLFDGLQILVAIDPKRRWMVTTGATNNGIVKLVSWPEGVPLEDLPRPDLLARLKALTNLRAESDTTAEFGFRIKGMGIPVWADPPR